MLGYESCVFEISNLNNPGFEMFLEQTSGDNVATRRLKPLVQTQVVGLQVHLSIVESQCHNGAHDVREGAL
jgi:hypothetical protein